MPAAVTGYEIGVFIHVVAVVLAFGPTFGYAFSQAVTERNYPRGVPTMWRAQEMTTRYLVTPAAIVVLLAGLYLTIDAWEFSDVFVGVGIVAIVVLLGLAGGFFNPQGRRAMELAERDIAAAGQGEVEFGDEYWAVSKRIASVGTLAGVIIVVTIFFMTVKP
jgi:hypothetical protein